MSEVELSLALAHALREVIILRERVRKLRRALEYYCGDGKESDTAKEALEITSET